MVQLVITSVLLDNIHVGTGQLHCLVCFLYQFISSHKATPVYIVLFLLAQLLFEFDSNRLLLICSLAVVPSYSKTHYNNIVTQTRLVVIIGQCQCDIYIDGESISSANVLLQVMHIGLQSYRQGILQLERAKLGILNTLYCRENLSSFQ